MNYQKTIEEIYVESQEFPKIGEVSASIPELKNISPDKFGIFISTHEGTEFGKGDFQEKISIQSVSKVFTLCLAFSILGEKIWQRVNVEPSGNAFNSLVQLENEKGIPRNPFINAGAIVTADSLVSIYKKNTFDTILDFIKKTSNDETISYDEEIFESELANGFRNFALINMIKSFNNINNNIDEVIDTYFKQCSIMMNCSQLAKSMLFLANHGINPLTNEQIITESKAKRINSLMLTCGHYDASGDFAYKVGLPGKSGVGGGIVAVVPKKMTICVYSPKLNLQGNSLVGTIALELFTTKTGLSIF